MQRLVVLTSPTIGCLASFTAVQRGRYFRAGRTTLKPGPMQEPKVRGTCSLTGKPEPSHVCAQVLVHLQSCARWPVGVATVRPGLGAPAWEHECRGFGDFFLGEHLAQDVHDLRLGLLVALAFSAPGELVGHRHENDVGVWQESGR